MDRRISGFHQDEENSWVAELECGHQQHVRHNPPMTLRSWVNDEKGRKTVMTLIKDAYQERLFPVGRLDKETTGLLLFTNDGILAKKK